MPEFIRNVERVFEPRPPTTKHKGVQGERGRTLEEAALAASRHVVEVSKHILEQGALGCAHDSGAQDVAAEEQQHFATLHAQATQAVRRMHTAGDLDIKRIVGLECTRRAFLVQENALHRASIAQQYCNATQCFVHHSARIALSYNETHYRTLLESEAHCAHRAYTLHLAQLHCAVDIQRVFRGYRARKRTRRRLLGLRRAVLRQEFYSEQNRERVVLCEGETLARGIAIAQERALEGHLQKCAAEVERTVTNLRRTADLSAPSVFSNTMQGGTWHAFSSFMQDGASLTAQEATHSAFLVASFPERHPAARLPLGLATLLLRLPLFCDAPSLQTAAMPLLLTLLPHGGILSGAENTAKTLASEHETLNVQKQRYATSELKCGPSKDISTTRNTKTDVPYNMPK